MKFNFIKKPKPGEYAPYFQGYINEVTTDNVIHTLNEQYSEALDLFKRFNETKWNYSYASGKWSIKEVLIHILDTERIFNYRALRISRKDKTPLPGFEQDDFINNTNWKEYSFQNIIDEYELVRRHSILFFNNMSKEMLNQSGISDDLNLVVKAIPFILAGHERHHLNVIIEMYL